MTRKPLKRTRMPGAPLDKRRVRLGTPEFLIQDVPIELPLPGFEVRARVPAFELNIRPTEAEALIFYRLQETIDIVERLIILHRNTRLILNCAVHQRQVIQATIERTKAEDAESDT